MWLLAWFLITAACLPHRLPPCLVLGALEEWLWETHHRGRRGGEEEAHTASFSEGSWEMVFVRQCQQGSKEEHTPWTLTMKHVVTAPGT